VVNLGAQSVIEFTVMYAGRFAAPSTPCGSTTMRASTRTVTAVEKRPPFGGTGLVCTRHQLIVLDTPLTKHKAEDRRCEAKGKEQKSTATAYLCICMADLLLDGVEAALLAGPGK